MTLYPAMAVAPPGRGWPRSAHRGRWRQRRMPAVAAATKASSSWRRPRPLPPPVSGLVAVPEALRTERLGQLLDPAPVVPAAILHVLRDVVVHPEGGIIFHKGRPVMRIGPAWRRADSRVPWRTPLRQGLAGRDHGKRSTTP